MTPATNKMTMVRVSYILPLRSESVPPAEFLEYLNDLTTLAAEVLLVDGSPEPVFRAIDMGCVAAVRHLRPDSDLASLSNGKVRGVLTGLRRASEEAVILADDDVRYTHAELAQIAVALDSADVVRPQNYFETLPWHARLDTARTLINRLTGGDWPGTLGVRRSTLRRAGGYDGNVLFENLELVRTVEAMDGRALCLQDLFIKRLPPTANHFWRQRVRQAYDEFARPARLLTALGLSPLLIGLLLHQRWLWIVVTFILAPVCLAEIGRRRAHGARVFRWTASLWAPIWVAERALCAWAALCARLALGGIPYSGNIVRVAGTSARHLKERQRDRRRTT
jgi:hypothetical protein